MARLLLLRPHFPRVRLHLLEYYEGSSKAAKLENFILFNDEWDRVSYLVSVLKPFDDITRELSGKKYSTIANVRPFNKILIDGIRNDGIRNEGINHVPDFVELKRDLIDALILKLKEPKELKIATFLHLVHKHLCSGDDRTRRTILSMTRDLSQVINSDYQDSDTQIQEGFDMGTTLIGHFLHLDPRISDQSIEGKLPDDSDYDGSDECERYICEIIPLNSFKRGQDPVDIRREASKLPKRGAASLREHSSFVGKVMATFMAVFPARFMTRNLLQLKNKAPKNIGAAWSDTVTLTEQAKEDLR
ncbi:hypothetical protein BGZ46_010549 [Entomortierella lignicola]|nr:hypothetical protein BGZ46_010549 [Entomortierella lignicola]